MKTLAIYLLVFTISAFPQNYKKVKIFINNNFDIEKLVTLSLDLEHSTIDREGGRILFVDESEFSSLQQSGLGYEILIDDWHAYYNSLPKISEGEKRIIKSESEMKFGVSGFKFGSMGGYYTFDIGIGVGIGNIRSQCWVRRFKVHLHQLGFFHQRNAQTL